MRIISFLFHRARPLYILRRDTFCRHSSCALYILFIFYDFIWCFFITLRTDDLENTLAETHSLQNSLSGWGFFYLLFLIHS